MTTARFEFRIYDEAVENYTTELSDWQDTKAAKARAMRLAKASGGPVDLAIWYDGEGHDWNDRYITTAVATFLPSWHEAGQPKHRCWHTSFEHLA